MSEFVIKIKEDGTIAVEEHKGGVKSFKTIAPDSLLACINASLLRGSISSGLLPRGCLAFTCYDNGERDVVLLHSENRANISFLGTEYTNFPLPRLVFGFRISQEGRITSCRLGVIANDDIIKPDTKMYHYPLSNVSGFALCTGNNQLPRCTNLYTLSSLPYLIMDMPNNLDRYKPSNNRKSLQMRELLELLKDKQPEYYYSDVLVDNKRTLGDFIDGKGY